MQRALLSVPTHGHAGLRGASQPRRTCVFALLRVLRRLHNNIQTDLVQAEQAERRAGEKARTCRTMKKAMTSCAHMGSPGKRSDAEGSAIDLCLCAVRARKRALLHAFTEKPRASFQPTRGCINQQYAACAACQGGDAPTWRARGSDVFAWNALTTYAQQPGTHHQSPEGLSPTVPSRRRPKQAWPPAQLNVGPGARPRAFKQNSPLRTAACAAHEPLSISRSASSFNKIT